MEDSLFATVLLPAALVVIMLSLGMSLTTADFRRVVVYPRGITIGIVNLAILSPLLAFAIAELFDLEPAMAVGLVLLGASPGGTMANLLTHLARLIMGGARTLDWDLIREMSANGIDIQCHTKTHSDLNRKASQQSMRNYLEGVERELTESAAVIRNKVGKQVTYLAYPYGETNSLVVVVAKKLGYRGAFTVERGGNPFFVDAYRIQRSMIYGNLTFQDFKKNLQPFTNQSLR